MNPPSIDAPAAERTAMPSAEANPPAPGAIVFPETSKHEPEVRPWELELLISGALVFSLLQLPGHADTWFGGVRPHLGVGTFVGVFMAYMYVKLILYTLITCFVLHLSMRAYWVGLIGLESVFPAGARWDDSNYGPVMKELYRERLGRLQPRIDAADRFCSILFPLAFTVVMLFCFSVAMAAVAGGLAFGISRLLFGGEHLLRVLMVIGFLSALFPTVTWIADRRYGARVEPGSRGHRLLRRGSLVSYYVNAMPIIGTTFMTLFTNVRKGVRYPVMYALLALPFGVFMVKDVYVGLGVVTTGDHLYLPDTEGAFGVDGGVYEDQRPAGEVYARTPSIQSDVVKDPYLKLFIPYAPPRHGEAFAQQCPGVRPLSDGGIRMGAGDEPDSAAVRAVLDCWTRLQPVVLDGRPIRPEFRFYTNPRSGIRGILAYIPVHALPAGEHLLTVGYPPRSADAGRDRAARNEPGRYYIRFWR
ncbi:MAG TPA: hypothetical protein VE871_13095 [Longimicrobium sp.]|nr:hypothetical protein [Longimicrobium sp.]